MADETNILDQLISRVPDESLRSHLAREVDLLRGSRHFGLVFDRHLPESVRLVDYPIRKGVRVALRDESSTDTWTVVDFADPARQVVVLSGEGGERPLSDLVVVREFNERIYPGLRSVERIPNGPEDAPWHVVINGENYHALQALRSTHHGKVDLIYIDPPYNTGNDGWIYNDRYVDQNDRAKSSKWLSFLERRLLIARDLLKPTGVIIVAIGDDEHHRLRMLLDQAFGSTNFLADVVWHGGRQNDARYVSVSTDHMLIYARDESTLSATGTRWREMKQGAALAREAAAHILAEHSGNAGTATVEYRKWLKKVPKAEMSEGVRRFDRVEPVTGRLYNDDKDLSAPEERPNRSKRPLVHPVTKKPTAVPSRGWALSDEEMDRRVAAGLVVFGEDEKKIPRGKAYLDESDTQVLGNVFERDRNQATRQLAAILGDKRFPFPKDPEVLMRWFRAAAPADAVILDFFGGSGTTTEAVMRLNAEDGGTRQSILVTNNVCRPRVSTVVTGNRPDGSKYSDGLRANVEMLDLVYLDPSSVRRGREFLALAPLLWLQGGARGERIDGPPDKGWALTETYGVLFDIDTLTAFADAVTAAATSGSSPQVLFIVTDSLAEYQQAIERLPVGIDTVQLYEGYLLNYTDNFSGGAR
ncbi:site-specific DNA-methyltransferase [Mycobacteroides abscessus]|uniref:site-specific DNA-methyltransferase n=1 Tax=Mycobacteroides abscessus TaxID=36809 RepID=UPI0019D1AD12|nr:site-specific DNA-methyltransferase [Mycobacteroides abscessus]MBN7310993.1 site-specific DNA-methyltransferase [Mycobacteroides abscessus subsp. abscessus]